MRTRASARANRSILDRIRDTVYPLEPDATVLLFGSRARGDARPDSDWDVLVLLDGPIDSSRSKVIHTALMDVWRETDALIHPIVMSREDWNSAYWRAVPLHQNVDVDGIQLSPKGNTAPSFTEEQMAEGREEVIRGWIRQAREALDDAEYLVSGGRWRPAIGRMYYAALYALSALLVSRGYRPRSHRGVGSLLRTRFGDTGLAPAAYIAFYNSLHESRLAADYSPEVRLEVDQVGVWLDETRRFVEFIEQLLEKRQGEE